MNPNPHQAPPAPARIVVRNRATFCEEVEAPELVARLLSGLPNELRQPGRFALFLGGCPEQAVVFDVLRYDPVSLLWTLDYLEVRVAAPKYEFWYLPVVQHYTGRKFK